MGTDKSEINTLTAQFTGSRWNSFRTIYGFGERFVPLSNIIPSGNLALPDFPGFCESPVSKWQTVRPSMFLSNKYLFILNWRI